MTNAELVAHVRSKLATAGLYPWWLGLQERDVRDLCDRLEAKDKELAAAAERIAAQSDLLAQHAEKQKVADQLLSGGIRKGTGRIV